MENNKVTAHWLEGMVRVMASRCKSIILCIEKGVTRRVTSTSLAQGNEGLGPLSSSQCYISFVLVYT